MCENDKYAAETRDLDEDTLIEFDTEGSLVSMTIEHASRRADIANFTYQQVAKEPARQKVAHVAEKRKKYG
jgi:uncharacterized protein YuzE